MDVKELFTLLKNHRHSGTHPDARKLRWRDLAGRGDASEKTVLISENGYRYIVGVDTDGAITTESLSIPAGLFVVDSEGEGYLISVDDDGALTSRPFSTQSVAYRFVRFVELYSDSGTGFKLEVSDDGAPFTSPL